MDSISQSKGMLHVSVTGTAFERGRQYGVQARAKVVGSITAYQKVFAHFAQWDWSMVVKHAAGYQVAIGEFAPDAIEEMRGIAEGAGVDFGDVLALNVRSEIMFASGVQNNKHMSSVLANECSSFAVLPESTLEGHTLVGQNWDWLHHARDTVVLLHVRRDDGPHFVTIVEAGLLAKTGVNTAGVASCTNTLVSSHDDGALGVPYHVVLRKLLDAESITDAVTMVFGANKALSGNFLLGDMDGLAIDLEAKPGGPPSVRVLMPESGILVHTNHFLSPDFIPTDSRVATSPGTLFRFQSLRSALEREAPSISVKSLQNSLADHRNFPLGVCSHGDERAPENERYATISSVIYDLDAGELHLSDGVPCGGNFRRFQFDSSGTLTALHDAAGANPPESDEGQG